FTPGSCTLGDYLRLSITDPSQPARFAGKTQPPCQGPGQGFALVVAALPAPPPVQRYGHHHVRPQLPQALLGVLAPKIAEQLGKSFPGRVFQTQDDLSK